MKVWKKDFPTMDNIDFSHVHLLLVRNTGEKLRYTFLRSMPDLMMTDYENHDVEVIFHSYQ